MNRLVSFLLLFFGVFLVFPVGGVSAQVDRCNVRCEVDADCGGSYRCYTGVCRLNACPAVSTCICSATQSGTTDQKKTVKTIPSPTPRAQATSSSTLAKTPKTGASEWVVAATAFVGLTLGMAGVFGERSAIVQTPEQIFEKRKNIKVS